MYVEKDDLLVHIPTVDEDKQARSNGLISIRKNADSALRQNLGATGKDASYEVIEWFLLPTIGFSSRSSIADHNSP